MRPGEKLGGSVVSWGGLKKEAFEADVLRLDPEGDVCFRFLTLTRTIVNAMQRVSIDLLKVEFGSQTDLGGSRAGRPLWSGNQT